MRPRVGGVRRRTLGGSQRGGRSDQINLTGTNKPNRGEEECDRREATCQIVRRAGGRAGGNRVPFREGWRVGGLQARWGRASGNVKMFFSCLVKRMIDVFSVQVSSGCFTWGSNLSTLTDINIRIPTGEDHETKEGGSLFAPLFPPKGHT